METKRFEIEVPFGKIVYAAIDEGELFYAAPCVIVGITARVFLDEVETLFSAQILDGKWKGLVINDRKWGDEDIGIVYTLFDDKKSAQDFVNDLNRK